MTENDTAKAGHGPCQGACCTGVGLVKAVREGRLTGRVIPPLLGRDWQTRDSPPPPKPTQENP